tara:strand:- start:6291 stop:6590 length:300 start_codon:yes stop_codon:yes gene_type:complete
MSDKQKLIKNVSFSNIVNVTLVPERIEYKDGNLKNILWWKDEDISKFRKECALEIKTVLSFSLKEYEKNLKCLNLEVNDKNLILLVQDKIYQLEPLIKL